jgi:ABC-type spermidine/putrescine transport system permease subunit II
MDLGADGVRTFRLVTFPALRSALLAGAGVQTLPIWIFTNLTRPNQAPVVNMVAVLLVLVSVVPIWLAQHLSEGTSEEPARERSQPGEGPRSHGQVPVAEGGDRCLREGTGVQELLDGHRREGRLVLE